MSQDKLYPYFISQDEPEIPAEEELDEEIEEETEETEETEKTEKDEDESGEGLGE